MKWKQGFQIIMSFIPQVCMNIVFLWETNQLTRNSCSKVKCYVLNKGKKLQSSKMESWHAKLKENNNELWNSELSEKKNQENLMTMKLGRQNHKKRKKDQKQ